MDKKIMTVPNVSVGADTEQPSQDCNYSINDFNDFGKTVELLEEEPLNEDLFQPLSTVTMSELYENIYLSRPPIIDGLLYPGTYIIAGASKLGKSFLMLQLGYHVSTGKNLWNMNVTKGSVLYLALEDTYPRLQQRLYRMFGEESSDDFYLSVSAGVFGKELEDQLRGFIKKHPDVTLIIIDTLQKVREAEIHVSYAKDYELIANAKKISDEFGVCIVTVHHVRKLQSDDKFDMISGTNGLLGAADGAFVFSKEKRTDNRATLDVTGRDQPEQTIYLERNEKTLLWEFDRAETELWKESPEPLLEQISQFITTENPTWTGTSTELANALGVQMLPNHLSRKLNVNAGKLLKDYEIYYESKRSHDGRTIKLVLREPTA